MIFLPLKQLSELGQDPSLTVLLKAMFTLCIKCLSYVRPWVKMHPIHSESWATADRLEKEHLIWVMSTYVDFVVFVIIFHTQSTACIWGRWLPFTFCALLLSPDSASRGTEHPLWALLEPTPKGLLSAGKPFILSQTDVLPAGLTRYWPSRVTTLGLLPTSPRNGSLRPLFPGGNKKKIWRIWNKKQKDCMLIALVSTREGEEVKDNKRAALIPQKALAAASTSYQVGRDGIQIQKTKNPRKSDQVSLLRQCLRFGSQGQNQ